MQNFSSLNCTNMSNYVIPPSMKNIITFDFITMLRKTSSEEYNLLCSEIPMLDDSHCEWEKTFQTSSKGYLNEKNRWLNILANEPTRVVVDGIQDEYINANFILDGKYISTQAPLYETISDFWLMIWQQKSSVIVMLTKYVEKKIQKAYPYFKECGESEKYGNFIVTTAEIIKLPEITAEITITKLYVSYNQKIRTIYHIHYTEWPDFGIPNSTECMRTLVKLTDKYHIISKLSDLNGPIICHCSAGVGRTGTFIAIHNAITQLNNGISINKINVFQIVTKMRNERNGMVQIADQYFFIYQTINDWIDHEINIGQYCNLNKKKKRRSCSLNLLPSYECSNMQLLHINHKNMLSTSSDILCHS